MRKAIFNIANCQVLPFLDENLLKLLLVTPDMRVQSEKMAIQRDFIGLRNVRAVKLYNFFDKGGNVFVLKPPFIMYTF